MPRARSAEVEAGSAPDRAPNMESDAALARFLAGAQDPALFRHADHIAMGFACLLHFPFLDSAQRYSSALRAMAQKAGRPEAYNATITIAYLALISERMRQSPAGDFDSFAAANADLFEKSCLAKWYAPARLNSALARETFVLP
jgi:hypothetical protein